MFSIEKKFTFEAAHLLNLDKDHPCSTIHGHSYKVYIKIDSLNLDKNGFIMDFGELKKFKEKYIDKLDHSLILTKSQKYDSDGCYKIYILHEEYKNTTVENLCEHFVDLLLRFFKEINFTKYVKLRVKIFETENNSGSFTYTNSTSY